VTRSARAAGALAVLALVSGCASDAPDSAAAGTKLADWMAELPGALDSGVEPLEPWTPAEQADRDQPSGCEDGEARRTYAATVTVPTQARDAGNRGTLVAGQLGQRGWEVEFPLAISEAGGTVEARREGEDPTGTRLRLAFTAVGGGWRYAVTARTACLSR
jgi:hypothetical protein